MESSGELGKRGVEVNRKHHSETRARGGTEAEEGALTDYYKGRKIRGQGNISRGGGDGFTGKAL